MAPTTCTHARRHADAIDTTAAAKQATRTAEQAAAAHEAAANSAAQEAAAEKAVKTAAAVAAGGAAEAAAAAAAAAGAQQKQQQTPGGWEKMRVKIAAMPLIERTVHRSTSPTVCVERRVHPWIRNRGGGGVFTACWMAGRRCGCSSILEARLAGFPVWVEQYVRDTLLLLISMLAAVLYTTTTLHARLLDCP